MTADWTPPPKKKKKKRRRQSRPRTTYPYRVDAAPERDPRVPPQVWALPKRLEQANLDGPRYNQTELARKSGLSQSVLSKLGSWSAIYGIRLDTLYRLSAALDVSVAWLLGETDVRERTAPSSRTVPRSAPPAPTAKSTRAPRATSPAAAAKSSRSPRAGARAQRRR